jgi:hypothetical protein
MKDYSTYYPSINGRVVNDTEILFREKLNTLDGCDVMIDEIAHRVIIHNHTNPLDEYKEDRKLLCLNEADIHRGSYVEYDNETYLVVTDIDKNEVFKTCKIRKCNNILTFINSLNKPTTIPCILSNRTLYSDGLSSSNYITLPDGKRSCMIPLNEETKQFYINQRFIFNHNAVFTISQPDDYTQNGILTLTMTQVEFTPNDDKINNLAYNEKISLIDLNLQIENKEIQIGNTYQLTPIITKDNIVIDEDVIYETSNSNIATVDTNGIITAINTGNCIVTAILKENESIYDSVAIYAIASPVGNNYSIQIVGNDILKMTSTTVNEYIANVYDNGVLINNSVIWNVDTSKVQIVYQDSTSIKLKAFTSSGSVVLKATLTINSNVYYEKTIQFKSAF